MQIQMPYTQEAAIPCIFYFSPMWHLNSLLGRVLSIQTTFLRSTTLTQTKETRNLTRGKGLKNPQAVTADFSLVGVET